MRSGRVATCLLAVGGMFAIWAAIRLLLAYSIHSQPSYPERLLSVVTDVEVHTLQVRWRLDLLLVPLLGACAFLVLRHRGREGAGIALVATLMNGALAIAMAAYPALVLSGRLESRFRTPLSQSLAFAVAVLAALMVGATVLAVIHSRDHPEGGSSRHVT